MLPVPPLLYLSGTLGYVFGGADEAGLRSDLLQLSPPNDAEGGLYTWSAPECSGARPSPRGMHAAAVAERGWAPLLMLHGGRGGDGSVIGLYKIVFHLFLCVQESIIPLLPPPIRITHTTAIRLRDFCAIYDLHPTLPVYAIHHTILAVAISCKG